MTGRLWRNERRK